MARNEQEQRDAADQAALFDKVIALLEARRRDDRTILNFDRRPHASSLNRNGHLLTYQEGRSVPHWTRPSSVPHWRRPAYAADR